MFLQFFPVTHVNSLGMLTKKVPTKKNASRIHQVFFNVAQACEPYEQGYHL